MTNNKPKTIRQMVNDRRDVQSPEIKAAVVPPDTEPKPAIDGPKPKRGGKLIPALITVAVIGAIAAGSGHQPTGDNSVTGQGAVKPPASAAASPTSEKTEGMEDVLSDLGCDSSSQGMDITGQIGQYADTIAQCSYSDGHSVMVYQVDSYEEAAEVSAKVTKTPWHAHFKNFVLASTDRAGLAEAAKHAAI